MTKIYLTGNETAQKYCSSQIHTKKIVNYLCTVVYKLTRLIYKQQHTNNLQSITPGPKLSWKTTSFFEGNKHKVIIINVLKLDHNFHEKFI